MKPKLVKLKDEDWEKLQYIAGSRDCDNLTDALRLCIREVYLRQSYVAKVKEDEVVSGVPAKGITDGRL